MISELSLLELESLLVKLLCEVKHTHAALELTSSQKLLSHTYKKYMTHTQNI